jgi:quercetin dioxygenase-like cupin family protein
MKIIRTPPPSRLGPAEQFTGTAWIDEIAVANMPSRLSAFGVHFAPGARTAWHRHPVGQVLRIVEGVGRVQSRHGSIEVIRAGDIVIAKPDEWHWHGASPDSFMTHLAIQEADIDGQFVYWGSLVSNLEYSTDSTKQ